MKKRIFFADLTHTGKGIHASTFPLGMSFVASYAKKCLADDFEISLFKFPEDLSKALIDTPPDFLCMSNYSWNLELAYKFSCLAKEKNPNLIVIFGGPNFPVDPLERQEFLRQKPQIDFYIQNEGEIGLVELVNKIQHYNFDFCQLKTNQERITNTVYLYRNQLIEGEFQRILDLDIIPSPYLSGLLDPFFDLPLSPMLETTRGCPFTCAYCADGIISKSKVARFSAERTTEELKYISERIKNVDELIVTDLNFGMYKEDAAAAKQIALIQEKQGWPVLVQVSLGKNSKTQIMEVVSLLGRSLNLGAAIQSSDPDVLRNIKRNNISLDAYRSFLEFGNKLAKDTATFTEVILALPGDKKETHFNSLRYGIENGAKNLRMYQAMLLIGTSMAAPEARNEFQYQTKFRVIPGGVGFYKFGNQEFSVAEIEEIIVGSKDLSFEDYVSCRVMHLLIESCYNNSIFQEIFFSLECMAVYPFECLLYLHQHRELYTPKMDEIITKFITATKDLFDSQEEAEKYLQQQEIIKKYISGDLGINELLVYKAELYLDLEDVSKVLLQAVKCCLIQRGLLNSRAENYLDQLREFVLCKKGEVYQCDKQFVRSFNYDFRLLEEQDYKIDLRTLELSGTKFSFKFYHNEMQKKHIQNILHLYANTPSGIGRVLQRANLKKMVRCFDYDEEKDGRAGINEGLKMNGDLKMDAAPENKLETKTMEVESIRDYSSDKILSVEKASGIIDDLKRNGKIVGLCHGGFDLTHPGHVKHFESAKKLCDVLCVSVTSDQFVNSRKGSGRPIYSDKLRAYMVAAIGFVDYVIISDFPKGVGVINLLRPSFYIKGPDYVRKTTPGITAEREAIKLVGGEMRYTTEPPMSTTKIIEYIKKEVASNEK